jgi:hypothetical protein
MNYGRQEAQNAGVDHREIGEIRERRVAFVRVFRVVRGENAVFFEPFEPFCGKSMQVAVQEPFTRGAEFFRLKSSQTQSNPVKPFFYFDWTLNRRPRLRVFRVSGPESPKCHFVNFPGRRVALSFNCCRVGNVRRCRAGGSTLHPMKALTAGGRP